MNNEATPNATAAVTPDAREQQRRKGRLWLFAVLLVCAAPIIASYFTYYVIKPEGRTNYGALIDPRQYPIPALGITHLDGKPAALQDFGGKWILLQVDGGKCEDACQRKLLEQRQLRLMQGKEMDRVERVWLITDAEPLDTVLMRTYDGTHMLRVDAAKLRAWLPVEEGTRMEDHLYMIDPLGNLMMRWPKSPDPSKVKKDIAKLLRASGIG